MGRKQAKVLIGFISVLVVLLISSTATTTVATGYWGNLKTGDTMKWRMYLDPVNDPNDVWDMEMEILAIDGDEITYKYKERIIYDDDYYGYAIDETYEGTSSYNYFWPYLASQSELENMVEDAKDEDDISMRERNHDWRGRNCRTYFLQYYDSEDNTHQLWWDKNTGILLEWKYISIGTYTYIDLLSTTATLTPATGICLGTILIAFVSVATLVSYSIVLYQQKKKKRT